MFSLRIMRRTVACPHCHMQETCEGKPGQKIILTCPRCGTRGYVSFPVSTPPHEKTSWYQNYLKKWKLHVGITLATMAILIVLFFIILPLFQGSLHLLTVLSGSMEPEMHAGDVIVSTKVDPENIAVGDIITFRLNSDDDPNRFVTHRVIEITERDGYLQFKTKGDANEDPDSGAIAESQVVGKVVFIIPYIGHIGNFARSILGYIVFIVIPALLLIGNELLNICRNRRKTPINH